MEVILLAKVENLGDIGDRVKVRAGYGRNHLIPAGKAAPATTANVEALEARRAELEREAAEARAVAQGRADRITALGGVNVAAKVAAEDKLFGSIGTVDIVEALAAAGIEVERNEVRLPDGPIRTVGDHEVMLHLHTDVNVDLKVVVTGEE